MPSDKQEGPDLQDETGLQAMRTWLSKQGHLPQNIDDQMIRRFLHSCHFSLERTKKTLDLCYTIRANAPEIFSNRDPLAPEIQQVFRATDMIPLPEPTEENYKVFIYRLADTDPDQFMFNACVKTFLMVSDVRLVSDQTFHEGEVPIFDMAGVSYKHLTRMVLPTLKKYMLYTQEAHPVRLKQIHVINCSSFLDKLMTLIKPLMKSQVLAMLHFHLPDSDTLEKFVPKKLLPKEYGGEQPSIAEIKREWIKRVEAHRDYFLDASIWHVDESKRPPETKKHESAKQLGMQGSFRSLSID